MGTAILLVAVIAIARLMGYSVNFSLFLLKRAATLNNCVCDSLIFMYG